MTNWQWETRDQVRYKEKTCLHLTRRGACQLPVTSAILRGALVGLTDIAVFMRPICRSAPSGLIALFSIKNNYVEPSCGKGQYPASVVEPSAESLYSAGKLLMEEDV